MLAALAALSLASHRVLIEPDAAFGATRSWHSLGPASASEIVTLTVVLYPEDHGGFAKLEEAFWAVSDPDSDRYGAHLSKTDVSRLVHASPAALANVTTWLTEHGASTTAGAFRDFIEAVLTVQDAEALLATRLHTFQHSKSGATLVRAAQPYSVPAHLASAVQIVEGVTRLPALDGPRVVATDDEAADDQVEAPSAWPTDCKSCGKKVTPAVLAQRYSIPPPPHGASAFNGSTLAVAEFQGQVWDQKDLDRFGAKCAGSISWKVTVDHEAGHISKGNLCRIPIFGTEFCGEALLDIEYAKAICADIPLTDVYASNYNLLKWADDVAKMSPIPLVHSVSYGNDETQQTSTAYMLSVNQAVMKLGALGATVLFASGDQGVCGRSGCGMGKEIRFHPDFPASSPYITSVGGTDFAVRNVVGNETTWPDGGGGFSDTFPIPSYQAGAVDHYKTTYASTLPNPAYFNNSGRGYPDVAALAGEVNPYCISAGSMMVGIAGTSAASPVVAAIIARLNAVRLGKGGKPLGFLNPFLYKHADAFNDVTTGVNDEGEFAHGGFHAAPGWDPATGLGTPNFAKLAALV